MMDEPGSFSGRESSPSPHLGPDPRNLMSFAILKSDTARVLSAPWRYTKASLEARASNLFSAVLNSYPVSFLSYSAILTSNPLYVLRPVPTAVPP